MKTKSIVNKDGATIISTFNFYANNYALFLLSFDKYGHYTRISICKTKNNPLTLLTNELTHGETVQFISDWYKP